MIFGTLSFRGCGGQPLALVWNIRVKSQMPITPEHAFEEKSTKLLILLPLRTIYNRTFQCETPCSINSKTINNSAYPIPIHKLLEESRVFVSILSLLSTTVEPWYSSKVHWKVPVWQNLQQKRLFIRFCTLKLKVNIWKIPLKSLFIPLSL